MTKIKKIIKWGTDSNINKCWQRSWISPDLLPAVFLWERSFQVDKNSFEKEGPLGTLTTKYTLRVLVLRNRLEVGTLSLGEKHLWMMNSW